MNIFRTLIAVSASLMLLTACEDEAQVKSGKLTEALGDSAWVSSEWISVVDAPVVTDVIKDGMRAADGANWFVSTIRNESDVVSAKWMTAGLGVYELYVNGMVIGEEILKPGFTHYAKTKISFTYDVTDAFNKAVGAENVLAAQVTPGWWADKIVTPNRTKGMIGKKCAFRGVLELTYGDGTKKLYGTDLENWKAGIAGPVKHAAIFDGEEYDAREPLGFQTPEKLSTPEINSEFAGEIVPTAGAEIYLREDLTLSPVRAYIWKEVEGANEEEFGKVVITKEFASDEKIVLMPGENLVVDFGQNASAVPSFEFKAKEGTVLTCLPSEILNDGNGAKSRGMDGPEGSIHRLNLRTPDNNMLVKYTFAGSRKPVSYYPKCSFFGYRYISVTATDKVVISSIRSVPVSSISKEMETGKIETGNDLVNQLISNTWWSQLSNYLSVTTDCPQRNERLGWTADTQVFAETGSFFADTKDFLHKWLRDLRDTQSPLGGYPGVAPLAQYGANANNMMRLGWADAGVIVPWTVWKQFGDTSVIDESWDSMEKFMAHVDETKYNHQALAKENGNYQWADWLSYEPLESRSGKYKKDNKHDPDVIAYWNYLSASYWLIDAGMMVDMAKATGRDAAKYEKMEAKARKYIKSEFFRPNGEFKTEILNTMQTPALFALKNNILEGEAKEKMIARLRKNFEEHDDCLQTGFLGTSILMQTLTENGMVDIAYKLLFQRKNPSWLYSVDNGATTIWERWNSYTLEHGMGPRGMNSFNHYAYGCVCEWLWETAAGISSDPENPGFKHIIMKPVPNHKLKFVNAEYKSAAGLIKSSWSYAGNQWIWDFTIPEGATASVTIPGEKESKEYGPGSHSIVKDIQ